jgi:hypothetical protein
MIGELIATGITYGVGRIALNSAFSGTAEFNNIILDSGANFSGGTGGGVIYSGGTDLYDIFSGGGGSTTASNGLTKIGNNIVLGGNLSGNTSLLGDSSTYAFEFRNINYVGFNNAPIKMGSGVDFSGGTGIGVIYSGGTDLYNIFAPIGGGGGSVTGTGTTNNLAIWDGSTVIGNSNIAQGAGGIELNDDSTVNANFTVTGVTKLYTSETVRKKTTHDIGTSGGTVNWDIDNSSNAKITLTSNLTLDISNVEDGDYGTLKITQGGAGGFTITLGTGTHQVVNTGAGSITLTGNAGAVDVITFFYDGVEFLWNVGNSYT